MAVQGISWSGILIRVAIAATNAYDSMRPASVNFPLRKVT